MLSDRLLSAKLEPSGSTVSVMNLRRPKVAILSFLNLSGIRRGARKRR